jgi:hypothetical protein
MLESQWLRPAILESLPSPSHQPQQAEEQIDEVKIQPQGAVDGFLGSAVGSLVAGSVHGLDLLGIVGG